MQESTKAALWSIFIFPGGGHFYLKKLIVGSLMAGVAIAALLFVLIEVVERANAIADRILAGEVPLDLIVITDMVMKQTEQGSSQVIDFAWYSLIAVWLIAAIDAYRLGRKKDKLIVGKE